MVIRKKSILRSLIKSISYVYMVDPRRALSRDISFILVTALDMIAIAIGGKFIDATAEILTGDVEVLSFREYFITESFSWLAMLLAIWVINKAFGNFRSSAYEHISYELTHRANVDILQKVSTENLQEMEQIDFQDLVSFVPKHSIGAMMNTYEAFTQVIRMTIRLITAISILGATMGPSVFFLILIAIPEPIIQFLGEMKLRKFKISQVDQVQDSNYLMTISTNVPNFPELRVNNIFKYILRTYRVLDRNYFKGLLKKFDMYYSDQVIMSSVGQIFKYIYVVYVLFESVARKLSIGDFKALFDYTNEVYSSAYNVTRQFFVMIDQSSYTDEFFQLIEYRGFADIDPTGRLLKKGTPQVELQNFDFQYPDEPEVKVLRDVNVVIKPGEKVAFVGGDGSGKSSLVKTFCGLFELVAGDYVLDGLSVRELKRGELKAKISVVFQNFVRYNFSIQENITISSDRTNLNKKLYQQVKKIAGVNEFMQKEKLTDSQMLGKEIPGGKEISPGYWQRLAIARMLYRNKSIFIMDEPFTFIDGPSQEKILKGIMNFLGRKKTLIYITQNTDHLEKFDTVYYIHEGKIVESGTYQQLMRKRGKFYKEAKANQ